MPLSDEEPILEELGGEPSEYEPPSGPKYGGGVLDIILFQPFSQHEQTPCVRTSAKLSGLA
jgi:hypothetical protein